MSTQNWTNLDPSGIYRKEVPEGTKYRMRISVLDDQGERHREQKTLPMGTTLAEAVEAREARIAEIKNPDDPAPPSTTIASCAKEWIERNETRWSASYIAQNRRLLAQKVLPHFGHLTVDELSMEHIKDWIKWAEAQRTTDREGDEVPYAQTTLDNWWGVVKKLMRAMWQYGHISRDFRDRVTDDDGIPGPQSPRSDVQCKKGMTARQLNEYLDAARQYTPGRYAEIVTLAFTGMRCGELYALKWDYIDRERDVIWIRQAVWEGEEKPPKTGEVKKAPIAEPLYDVLREHREQMFAEQHPGLETGLIFPSDVGTHRYPSSLTKPMKRLSNIIDLGWTCSPHNLRRTFVNLMRRAGVDKVTRRSIVGHQGDDSEEPYLDVPDEDQHAAMDVFVNNLFTEKGA